METPPRKKVSAAGTGKTAAKSGVKAAQNVMARFLAKADPVGAGAPKGGGASKN